MDIKQLTKACMVGVIAKVEAIVAEGEVDVNSVDDGGCTPLYYAMMFVQPPKRSEQTTCYCGYKSRCY